MILTMLVLKDIKVTFLPFLNDRKISGVIRVFQDTCTGMWIKAH